MNQKNSNKSKQETTRKNRSLLIAGNWKMYKDHNQAYSLALALKERLIDISSVKVVLCPPFTSLQAVSLALKGSSLFLGAQNIYWETEGAFTGEISPLMLLSLGCKYVIIGHSERRNLFQETNKTINLKLRAALKEHITPIFCIGETLQERERGKTELVIEEQLKEGLYDFSEELISRLVLAYEPIWAIGTGKTATPKQANDVHLFIRKKIEERFGLQIASSITILYGGSVKPENAKDLLKEPEIDGALVGGASLNEDSFEKIIRSGIN